MPFSNQPLQFTVCAEIVDNRLKLKKTETLLRYLPAPSDPKPADCPPLAREVVAAFRRSGTQRIAEKFWDVVEIGSDRTARLFKLTFRGAELWQTALEPIGAAGDKELPTPNRNLYEAFLEQDTILLQIAMGKEDDGHPYLASLYLKLQAIDDPTFHASSGR